MNSLFERAKRNHKVACGGRFMSREEFESEPVAEQERFGRWLAEQARDVRRESRVAE